MKNKLYICKHQFVVSDKNICEKCCIEDLKKNLENSVITTFDDTPIFNQQFLNQHSQMIDKTLKLQLENQTKDFLSLEKSLKSKITELDEIISNGKKENKRYNTSNGVLLYNYTVLIESYNKLEESLYESENKYKSLKENYNRLAKDECDNSRMLSMSVDDLVKTENKLKLLNISNLILVACVIFFIIRLFLA